MRAVVMAGGEGTRLRPLTANRPKPLLPVANRPIMEHVLRLLRRHGFDDTIVTLQYLASHVRSYFGDGEELGMTLSYATEDRPLGTAGSVKNAAEVLRDEPFLVISGDALTDIDLTALVDFHRRNDAMVTVALKRVSDPLDFGIVITGENGRIERFLEKPTWGQVFSDTVNTGIYVMSPDVLDHVPDNRPSDWSHDVFPELLADGARLFGYVFDGYWEDVGTHESYARAQSDVLTGTVRADIDGFEVSPGLWLGEGAEVSPDAKITAPVLLGRNVRVMDGAEVGELTVLGDNVVVNSHAVLLHAVVMDNAFVGPQAQLHGCVISNNTTVLRAARIAEAAVVGDDCVIEEEAFIASGVRIYPGKRIEAGAQVTASVIWESRGSRAVFGHRGVSGQINVEITPEFVVRLASAWATLLPKGSVVTAARDASRAARAYERAAVSALTTSGIDVYDLEVAAAPVARQVTAVGDAKGGVLLRTSPGDQQSIDIVLLDEHGVDIGPSVQRTVERTLSRGEFRRASVTDIGELSFPTRTVESYLEEVLRRVDVSGVREARLKVVVDVAAGATTFILPHLVGRLGIDALTMNVGVDERVTAESAEQAQDGLRALGAVVESSRADFGVRFDQVGERLSIVDECGRCIDDERALLVLVDLVAAERRHGLIALPVSATRVAEQVTSFHGVGVRRTGISAATLPAALADGEVLFGGDGRGGFVIPEMGASLDAVSTFVRLAGLVARTRMPLSQIDARIPQAFVEHRAVSVPWANKGAVMRAVVERTEGHEVDITDGVRLVLAQRRWMLVLPDQSEAVVHIWAEAENLADARALLAEWATIVGEAGR